MKILYGVMESHKSRTLTEFSLKTWLNPDNILIFTDRINENDNRFVKITGRDDYHSNAIKCILGLRYMFEKDKKFDFYVFIDNDTYLNINNLESFLLDKNPNELKAFGNILNGWTDDTLLYLSGGAGIVLTNKAMCDVYDKLEKNEKIFECTNSNSHPSVIYDYSDVTLGFHMREVSIELIDSPLFHSQPPEYYKDIVLKDSISFHYINTIEKMKKIYEL
jgi:hypothetical protein